MVDIKDNSPVLSPLPALVLLWRKKSYDNRSATGLGREIILVFLNMGKSELGGTWACLRTISAKMQPRLQISTAVE